MSTEVTLVVCDHHCRPEAPVDYEKLRSDLCAAACINEMIIAPTACRSRLPELTPDAARSLIIAGCPAVSQAANYAELAGTASARRPVIIADTRTEIFDLYRTPAHIQENLRRKLLSLSLVLSAVGSDEVPQIKLDGPVLVAGDGFAGILTALHLQSLGVTVEVARSPGSFYSPGSYHISLSTPALEEQLALQIQDSQSWSIPENLRAVITDDGVFVASGTDGPRRYASLVLVPEQTEVGPWESGAISLSECYARITNGDDLRGSTCFLLDQSHPTDPGTFSDVMRAALQIVKRYRGDVTVLMQDARISGTDGQHLYDTCREAGVVFIKYGGDLSVESEYGDFVITGTDAQSAAHFTIHGPQTVVVPGQPGLPSWALTLMDSLALRDRTDACTQDESLWLLPNATNRGAVFTAGASRQRMDADEVVRDAVSAALSAARVLADGGGAAHTAVVREGACIRCLTCVRSCPFGAIRKEPGNRAAAANPVECRGCGICVAVCPARAIELQDRASDALVDSIGVLRGLLVLHCAEGGRKAVRKMIEAGKTLPPDVSLYELPCTGRVEESIVLDVLGKEIEGVLVIGCRKDNCKFLDGNKRGENRVRRLQQVLTNARIERLHVEMMFAAPDEGGRVYDAIMDAHKRISDAPGASAESPHAKVNQNRKG